MKIRNAMKEFAIITVGTAIVAAAVFFFGFAIKEFNDSRKVR